MQKIRKAEFPLAGHDTRFLPMTKSSPKGMLPIIDKPVVQYALKETVEAEIGRLTEWSSQAIEDHFDTSYEFEDILRKKNKLDILEKLQQIALLSKISYIRQKEAPELGHTGICSELIVGNKLFAVALEEDLRLFLKGVLTHRALGGIEWNLTEKEEYVS